MNGTNISFYFVSLIRWHSTCKANRALLDCKHHPSIHPSLTPLTYSYSYSYLFTYSYLLT